MRSCDFCLTHEAKWTYLTMPFEVPALGEIPEYHDGGKGWFACDGCRDLIDNAPFEAVIANAEIMVRFILGEHAPEFLFTGWRRVAQSFNVNRIGDAMPINQDLPEPTVADFLSSIFNHPSQGQPFDWGDE